MTKGIREKTLLIEELQGDCLTPVSIYRRLKGRKKFLLESSLKHEKQGRFSFIGCNPSFELKGFAHGTELTAKGRTTFLREKPLEVLKTLFPARYEGLHEEIPFIGGTVGFIGYDVVRHYGNVGKMPDDELGIPDVHLMGFEEMAVFDHLQEKVFLIATPLLEETTSDDLQHRLQKLKKSIMTGTEEEERPFRIQSFQENIGKEKFMDMVKSAKKYIADGEVFQVVLSRRLKASVDGDPFSFYRKLRVKNPTPYMYYLDFADYALAGTSPESLIKCTGKKVTTNPIAGTRPRGRTPEEDKALEAELMKDEKELAEHRMLVDLGRNDIGRVCRFGTVKLDKYMKVEKYRHVMHIVSEVSGQLREDCSPVDAFLSCLPAGTVSGAPKWRAMEIINELEETKRSFYSGAVGYFSANGNMDFALAIRTMLIKNNEAFIQGGAGIVHDSDPEKEFQETSHKLRAFLEEGNK